MKRCATALALLILCLFVLDTEAHALTEPSFTGALSETEGHGGDSFTLKVSCNGCISEVGAFLIQVDYDTSRFSCTRTTRSGNLQGGFASMNTSDGNIRAVYSMEEYPLSNTGNAFTFYFKVKDGAEAGEVAFELSVVQIVSERPRLLSDDYDTALKYTVLPDPSSDAALLSVIPSEGELVPAFSPDIFTYSLDVPFDVTSLAFTTETAEGAVCKVNRKNLGAGGSDTNFTLTVTAEDGETKQIYTVKVHRGEKLTATPKPKSTQTPSPTQKPESTLKPTSTPKPVSSLSPTASPTEKPQEPQSSESPEKAAAELAESEPPNGGTGSSQGGGIKAASSLPVLTIENGNTSLLPLTLVVMLWVFVLFISKPLAKLICAKLDKDDDEE